MAKPVGCGESANRIKAVRLTNDAVPFGHHILQTDALYFRRRHEGHEGFGQIIVPSFVLGGLRGE